MPADPSGPTRAELARELLRLKMEGYSEDFYCAGWLSNLEFQLWNAADKVPTDARMRHERAFSQELRILAEIAGGWWVFNHESRPGEDRRVFIPMERWHQILSQRTAAE